MVNVTIECLPLILKAKGNILNISTVGASHRGPNLSMYLGAKGAVENFTRCWALELAKDGVRVNAIAPGWVNTEMNKELPEDFVNDETERILVKRLVRKNILINFLVFNTIWMNH